MLKKVPEILMPLFTTPEKWLFANGVLPAEKLCLPDFLGIGAPQSGTTWLYENLRCHPGIFMSERKEVRYFEKNFHKSLSLYYAPKFKTGAGKVKGEISPSYGIMPLGRIHFIRKLMPHVKLLLILRNPVERVWSSTRRAFGKIPGKRIDDASESEVLKYFNDPERRAHTDYLNILDHWLSVFPKEQLCVTFFDEIVNDPQSLLRNVFSFLEVSQDVDWEKFPFRQVINRNPEKPMPEKYRAILEKIYERDIELLCRRFGAPFEKWKPAARNR